MERHAVQLYKLIKWYFIYCSRRKRHNVADIMHTKRMTFSTKVKIDIHLEFRGRCHMT